MGVLGFFDVDTAAVALYAVGGDAIGKAKGWVAAYEDGDDVEGIGVFFQEHHKSFLVDNIGNDGVVAQFAQIYPIVIASNIGVGKHTGARRHLVLSDEVMPYPIALVFTHGARGVAYKLTDA